MKISLIAAVSKNNVTGVNGKIPWHIPEDFLFFKKTTTGHHILMGKNTYNSIGKPLPNRTNIVLTRDTSFKQKGCVICHSINEAVNYARKNNETELFIIGGEKVYEQTIDIADHLYITRIEKSFKGDTFFPKIDNLKWKIKILKTDKLSKNSDTPFSILKYTKI